MKKIFLSLLAIAAVVVSCKKEASSIEPAQSSKTITIAASCDDVTKATFSALGAFSWESDDEISYILHHTDGHYDGNALATTNSGSNATFTGSTTATDYTPVNLAFYPKNRNQGGVNNNTLAVNNTQSVKTLQATLAGTITARPDRLSRIIPMIGKKTGEDSGQVEHYHFYPVTGVLKVSFTGLPPTASQIRLTVPDAATYPLNGTFNIDTERAIPEIKATDVATGYDLKYLNFDYAGSDDTFYIPIPTGTIPAGKLTVSVTDGTNILHSVNCKQEIVVTRGEITELPSMSVCPVTVSVSGTSSAIIANLTFEVPTIAKAKVVLAESIDAGKTLIDNNDDAVQTLLGTGSTSALSTSNISGTKKCYIVVRPYDTSDKPRGTVGILVYSLSSTDAALLGHYTHATEASCKQGGSVIPNPASFTIVASNNPTICNMMVSEFDGMTCTNKVPGIYDPTYTKVTWDNFNKPFDTNSPAKRFARSSGMDTKLNFVFTFGTPNTFYADANFGYVTGDSHPWTWQYYYYAGSGHVYTQQP